MSVVPVGLCGTVNLLTIFGADRLVAEPVALLQLVARIKDLGGSIASYRDGRNLDTTDPHSKMAVFRDGIFNEMRLDLNRTATKAGIARRRAPRPA